MLNMPCVFQLVNSINLSFVQHKFIEYPPNEKHICGMLLVEFAAVFKLGELRIHGQRGSMELNCNHGINSVE